MNRIPEGTKSIVDKNTLRSLFVYDHITGHFIRKKNTHCRKQGSRADIENDGKCTVLLYGDYYPAEELVMVYMYNLNLEGLRVVHIDGNKANNAFKNLKVVCSK